MRNVARLALAATIVSVVGTAAAPPTAQAQASDVARISGGDRYATAAAIAAHQAGPSDRVYLARSDLFVDALTAGALTDGPILLTPPCGDVPEATAAAITDLNPSEVVAIGGPGAVCDTLLAAAGGGRATSRLAGPDRYTTAVAISQHAFPDGAAQVFLTVARDNPDAVAAGPLTAGPVLPVPDSGPVPAAVKAEIDRLDPVRVTALGGSATIPDAALAAAAGSRPSDRLAGGDRYSTAVEIAKHRFPDGASMVYLARADLFADAVAGGILTNGPIVLVPQCGPLPDVVDDYLNRMRTNAVRVLGGPVAVCDDLTAAAAAHTVPLPDDDVVVDRSAAIVGQDAAQQLQLSGDQLTVPAGHPLAGQVEPGRTLWSPDTLISDQVLLHTIGTVEVLDDGRRVATLTPAAIGDVYDRAEIHYRGGIDPDLIPSELAGTVSTVTDAQTRAPAAAGGDADCQPLTDNVKQCAGASTFRMAVNAGDVCQGIEDPDSNTRLQACRDARDGLMSGQRDRATGNFGMSGGLELDVTVRLDGTIRVDDHRPGFRLRVYDFDVDTHVVGVATLAGRATAGVELLGEDNNPLEATAVPILAGLADLGLYPVVRAEASGEFGAWLQAAAATSANVGLTTDTAKWMPVPTWAGSFKFDVDRDNTWAEVDAGVFGSGSAQMFFGAGVSVGFLQEMAADVSIDMAGGPKATFTPEMTHRYPDGPNSSVLALDGAAEVSADVDMIGGHVCGETACSASIGFDLFRIYDSGPLPPALAKPTFDPDTGKVQVQIRRSEAADQFRVYRSADPDCRDRTTVDTVTVGSAQLVTVHDDDPSQATPWYCATAHASGHAASQLSHVREADDIRDIRVASEHVMSVNSDGDRADDNSHDHDVSADGRWVAFASRADNLGGTATTDDNVYNVYLHDRQTGTTIPVSTTPDGKLGDDDSRDPSVSGDGRYVAFNSDATNLDPNEDDGSLTDVFLFDRLDGSLTSLMVNDAGEPAGAVGSIAHVSDDGSAVVFWASGDGLYGDVSGPYGSYYVYDVTAGAIVDGWYGNGGGQSGHGISPDGRWVVTSEGLGDTRRIAHDRTSGQRFEMPLLEGTDADSALGTPRVALDAAGDPVVVFATHADNLVEGSLPDDSSSEVYLWRPLAGTVEMVTEPGGHSSYHADIGPQATTVVYDDGASILHHTLATGGVRKLASGRFPRVSVDGTVTTYERPEALSDFDVVAIPAILATILE